MLSIYLHRGDLYSDLWKSDLYFGLADWGEIRLTFCWRLKPARKLSIWGIPWDAKREQQGKGGARARNGSRPARHPQTRPCFQTITVTDPQNVKEFKQTRRQGERQWKRHLPKVNSRYFKPHSLQYYSISRQYYPISLQYYSISF